MSYIYTYAYPHGCCADTGGYYTPGSGARNISFKTVAAAAAVAVLQPPRRRRILRARFLHGK